IEVLRLAFSMENVMQCLFLINVLNRELEFNSIWKLAKNYGCQTSPHITDLIFEDKSYDNSIEILFPGHSIPLGKFRAPDADSKFKFEVNEFFLCKI
ncbi:MAG TPA: hypothetical protein VNZ49_09650, partial [Bacteroidia bacterium]|nr:hypothetical protein [Bacteroidia bacterium]